MSYHNSVWLNIPVTNLDASIKFYRAIGFTQNHTFSSPEAAMMSWTTGNEPAPINYMLLAHPFFGGFLPSGITRADPAKTAQCIVCLSSPSREVVDSTVEKAAANGAKIDIREKLEIEKQMEARGMYSRFISDPDGHLIELMYFPAQPSEPGK